MKRKHCSKLPDVKPVKTSLSLIRNFLMQEDDSSTIEEGFTIVRGNICAPIDPELPEALKRFASSGESEIWPTIYEAAKREAQRNG